MPGANLAPILNFASPFVPVMPAFNRNKILAAAPRR